jgi:hypothetical protein
MNKVPMKLRSYVGKMFELKKSRNIYGSIKSSQGSDKARFGHEDFPTFVVVLDENNTRVRVQRKDGSAVWIGKYFLLQEVIGETTTKETSLYDVLEAFKTLVAKVDGGLTPAEQRQITLATTTITNLLDEQNKVMLDR